MTSPSPKDTLLIEAAKKYSQIKQRKGGKNIERWGKEGFCAWYVKQPKKCIYCGITEEESRQFYNAIENYRTLWKEGRKSTRGKTLELDKKDNKRGYAPDNCGLACYYCNNAKSDVFGPEEFKIIARSIQKIIRERIGKGGLNA